MSQFKAADFYLIDDLFTEEERMVRDTIRGWVDERFMPLIEELFPGQDAVIASYEHAVFVEPRLTDKPRA